MKKNKFLHKIVAIFVIGSLTSTSPASEPIGALDSYHIEFENYILDEILPEVPGAALVIVGDGKIQLIKGYGVRTAGSTESVTPHTVFRLASLSKSLASASAGILVQKQQLDWQAKIKTHLEYLRFKNPDYDKQITLQNVLSHSTGLMPHAYTNLIEDNVPYQKVVRRLHNVDFICAPGKCYGYQNVVFSLVGDIIQKKSGQAYEVFVKQNLFEPLGMQNASFGLTAFTEGADSATPHIRRKGSWKPVKVSANYYNISPAAGANASIDDMSKWLLAQLGQRQDVLADSTLNALHNKVIKTSRYQAHYGNRQDLGDIHYGLGWRVFDYGQHKDFVHHGGWVKGTRSEMVFNRELNMGMVFLTNAETKFAGDVVFKFLELYERNEQSIANLDHEQSLQNTDQLTNVKERSGFSY